MLHNVAISMSYLLAPSSSIVIFTISDGADMRMHVGVITHNLEKTTGLPESYTLSPSSITHFRRFLTYRTVILSFPFRMLDKQE